MAQSNSLRHRRYVDVAHNPDVLAAEAQLRSAAIALWRI